MQAKTVLVVDDEVSVQETLQDILEDNGYRVELASNGEEGLYKIESIRPDVVLLDLRMQDMDGIEVLQVLNKQEINVPVILITAYGNTSNTISAMKLGAFDYITKPLKLDNLLAKVEKAADTTEMSLEVKEEANNHDADSDSMIGMSPIMQDVYKTIGRVADSTATVMIRGDSGTGKELVARAIHYNSDRHNSSFIKINCASIPENLLESELFGHEKGAFTGATTRKPGKFELAHKGTLFLDEIGEMAPATQAKVLRVLQEMEFERVGGTEPIKVDVRIIAATNKDLEESIRQGEFREDLFYRLNVVEIKVPPLRERKEDIPQLVEHICRQYSKKYNKPVTGMSPDALEVLKRYDWPGNIRELKNVCERSILMSGGPVITVDDLPVNLYSRRGPYKAGPEASLKEIVAEVEREVILKVLEEHNWNRSAAAQALKMNRSSFYIKLKDLEIID
ncbi:MAG: sigma-54-dependent Fis family transcriptional regulator [Firmicutes bacterium]|nr:sigma-54-dependent Fis family transcriptional regulator [Bacillota bacterium]